MKNELFHELQTSIKEGGKILKGKRKPSREFNIDDPDHAKCFQIKKKNR